MLGPLETEFRESALGGWPSGEWRVVEINSFVTALSILVIALGVILLGIGFLIMIQLSDVHDEGFKGVLAVIGVVAGIAVLQYPLRVTLEVQIEPDRLKVSRLFQTAEITRTEIEAIQSKRHWGQETTVLSGRSGSVRIQSSATEPSPVHLLVYRWAGDSHTIPALLLPLKLERKYSEYLARTLLFTILGTVASALATWIFDLGTNDFENYFIVTTGIISFLATLIYNFVFSPLSFEFNEESVRKDTLFGDTEFKVDSLIAVEWQVRQYTDVLVLRKKNGKLRIPGTVSDLPLGVLASVLSKHYMHTSGEVGPVIIRSYATE